MLLYFRTSKQPLEIPHSGMPYDLIMKDIWTHIAHMETISQTPLWNLAIYPVGHPVNGLKTM